MSTKAPRSTAARWAARRALAVEMVRHGLTGTEAADRLGIGRSTVRR